MSTRVPPPFHRLGSTSDGARQRQAWALLRQLGRRLCLALLVLGLPLQGMATAVGHIDRAAHVHRAAPARLDSALAAPASDRPMASPPIALPPGMPVLLSVDELRHSHGAPMRLRGPGVAPPHDHAGVGRHRHATDDATVVVVVADPGNEAAGPGGTKRVLLDVDTPPSIGAIPLAGTAAAHPQHHAATDLPEPRPDRLERPPRPRAD